MKNNLFIKNTAQCRLIIIAHPNFKDSLANRTIIENLKADFPNATYHDLQALYPDF